MFTTFIDYLDVSANSVDLLQDKINKMKKENSKIIYTPEFKSVYEAGKGLPGDLLNLSKQNTQNYINNHNELFNKSNKNAEKDFIKISSDPHKYIDKYWVMISKLRYIIVRDLNIIPDHSYEIWVDYDGNPKHNAFIKYIRNSFKIKFFEKLPNYILRVCLSDAEAFGYFLFTGVVIVRNRTESYSISMRTHSEKLLVKKIKEITD